MTIRPIELLNRTIIYYPLSLGRNCEELYPVITALKTADWQPGDNIILSPTGSCGTAKDRMEDGDIECKDWFFCTKKLDNQTVLDKVLSTN